MAFIDWLNKQHADSLIASQRMAADPFLRGIKPGANTAPAPPGAIPFQKTKPGFFARGYKKEDLVKKVMIEKNDGTKEIKSEWEEPRFPVHRGSVMATALPTQQPTSSTPMAPGRVNPAGSLDRRLDISRWGGAQGVDSNRFFGQPIPQIANRAALGMMASDPGWAGVPRARPQRSLANMGMDLRPRLEMPGQAESLARIPRQQMPPPQAAGALSIPQQTQQNIWGSRFVPNPAPMIRKDRSSLDDLPVGMDEEQWKFILDRIYGGNN